MTTIINKKEILSIVEGINVVDAMEEGFIQYSNGKTIVPPVAELLFDRPPGDVHIKYGYIKEDHFYCIKIASGFYDNAKLGIPSSQGMMLLFSQKTGQPVAVLLDDGYLTDIRTAAAGALAARYFAPKHVSGIGIIGTGIQAKLQLKYLQSIRPCKSVWVWGRSSENAQKFKDEMGLDYDIHIASTTREVLRACNLIVTTTPSETPLLVAHDIRPGTHITAMGSDTRDKQELDGEILAKADLVVADSLPQSQSRGEVFQAINAGVILSDKVVELGKAIQDDQLQRTHEDQISVVDLTGVAVQDIMIATEVYRSHLNQS